MSVNDTGGGFKGNLESLAQESDTGGGIELKAWHTWNESVKNFTKHNAWKTKKGKWKRLGILNEGPEQ